MTQQKFELTAKYSPTGDQPQAIEKLSRGVAAGMEHQVLLGVTGSGKTYTMANVIEKVQKPTLVISHNKTLAAQLYQEFREFFPENSVNYFVSYYDYYQPEAYVPQRDLYIEKEAEINKQIEKLRHSTTQALMTRRDVIVVASVSCIYGLGRPEDYAQGSFSFRIPKRAGASPAATEEAGPYFAKATKGRQCPATTEDTNVAAPQGAPNEERGLKSATPKEVAKFTSRSEKERALKRATPKKGEATTRGEALQGLIRLLYKRNDWGFKRGCFRVRGDTIEVYPPYGERVLRLEFLGEKLSGIKWVEPETRNTLETLEEATLYPAEHFITPEKRRERAIKQIEQELESQLRKLRNVGKDLEAHRLKQRTEYDLEMLEELGFCSGIENYSRYLSGREEGEAPYTLLDYFGRNSSEVANFSSRQNKERAINRATTNKVASFSSRPKKAGASCTTTEEKERRLTAVPRRVHGSEPANMKNNSGLQSAPQKERALKGATTKNGSGWLCIIDESHMTVPQIRGMYNGDRARKETLVEYGFRLPSALDNRPLRFNEFLERVPQIIYTSATPGEWEIERAQESAKLQITNFKFQKQKEKSKEAGRGPAATEDMNVAAPPWGAKKERGLTAVPQKGTRQEGATSGIHSGVVEQLIRPTGLLDPEIEVRPTEDQISDLVQEIVKRKEKGERVLVTTLTKRMAEELAEYLNDPDKVRSLLRSEGGGEGKSRPRETRPDKSGRVEELGGLGNAAAIRTHYLHSEIETLERSDILADLRRGKYDVVVGINLLREGLDLPEVSLVAILDADKEGFLRSETSLIQTMGRAARHKEGKAILYADKMTDSMRRAIDEIERRRSVQKDYNEEHDITPETIKKPIRDRVIAKIKEEESKEKIPMWREMPPHELEDKIWEWEREMREAADELDFERAAELRDKIREAQSTL